MRSLDVGNDIPISSSDVRNAIVSAGRALTIFDFGNRNWFRKGNWNELTPEDAIMLADLAHCQRRHDIL
jgi:hypothetical protein